MSCPVELLTLTILVWWFLFAMSPENHYFLPGALDPLLCGNSSDAGYSNSTRSTGEITTDLNQYMHLQMYLNTYM